MPFAGVAITAQDPRTVVLGPVNELLNHAGLADSRFPHEHRH